MPSDSLRQSPRGPDATLPPRLDRLAFPIQGPQAPAAWARLSPKSAQPAAITWTPMRQEWRPRLGLLSQDRPVSPKLL